MKILKIKRVFAWVIYNNLRNTPPKSYPTTSEIKSTITDVMPALKTHLTAYLDFLKKVDEINVQFSGKNIDEKKSKAEVDAVNKSWMEYNKKDGLALVEVSLDEEGFKTLEAQFSRDGWGNTWLANVEEFAELLEAFETAAK